MLINFISVRMMSNFCNVFIFKEKDKIIAPISDSPKPPPCRVTMTLPVVNNTKCAVFASCGAGKAEIVQVVILFPFNLFVLL